MVKFILIKSPDEWATTKQACRDELVVYVFFSSVYMYICIYIYIYIYIYEWATTKQACRDEIVVYLSFSSIYTTLYFYVLSTVLRKSSFTLYIHIYIYSNLSEQIATANY